MIIVKKTLVENEHITAFNGWMGRVVESGTLSLENVAKLCSDSTMITRADALGVLTALFDECENALKNGFTVDLGDIGSLHLTVSNKMEDRIEDWSLDKNLTSVNIRYTTSTALREAVSKGNELVKIKVVE